MSARNTIDDRAGWSPAPERLGTPGSTCTPEEMARALSSILRSAPFRGAPLLRTLISFLVRQSQEDEAPSLNATTIAVAALGKGPRFRSHKDASVRVAMNRPRTALQLYYAQEGVNDDIVIVLEPRNNRPLFRRRPEPRDPDSIEAALQLVASYQRILSPAANRSTLRVVQKELRSNPNHPLLLAAYTDLCMDSHKFNFGGLQHPMDEARRAMARAAPLAQPEYPMLLHVQACLALTQGDVDHARRNAETLIQAGPKNVEAVLLGELLMPHFTTPTLAMENASISPDDCRNTIPWLHITPFLAAYTTERYEAALESAVNFGLSHFFWGPALRAAALAQVGLKEAARSQVDKVVTLNADFAEAPRWYLQHHIRHEDTLVISSKDCTRPASHDKRPGNRSVEASTGTSAEHQAHRSRLERNPVWPSMSVLFRRLRAPRCVLVTSGLKRKTLSFLFNNARPGITMICAQPVIHVNRSAALSNKQRRGPRTTALRRCTSLGSL